MITLLGCSALQSRKPGQGTANYPTIIQLYVHANVIEPNTPGGDVVSVHRVKSLLLRKLFPALFDNILVFFDQAFRKFKVFGLHTPVIQQLNRIYRKPGFTITVSDVNMNG